MWAIRNHTPYRVGRGWGRDKEGIHEWIVAVKCTFDVREDGTVELAEEQLKPEPLPEYNGAFGVSSLRYDTDLLPPKPTTDVILNGTAHAPYGRPSTDFLATMQVGTIRKTLRVRGDRSWDGRGQVTGAQPVTQVPIIYERAYGGFDRTDVDPRRQRLYTRNPVGCGLVTAAGHPCPNLEYPSGPLDANGPAGFGALDGHWSPRRELAGTYDRSWRESRYPLLPIDWDAHSLLCSPTDQLPPKHLRGGELVELENLTPAGRLSFALPRVYLRFRTRIDTRVEEHSGHLSTVIIEPDYLRVILIWVSSLAVRTNGDYLEETIVSEKVWIR